MDYSLASATGLFNIHDLHWEDEALRFAGIAENKLPDAVPVFHVTKKLRKEYEKSLGLPAHTKIIIGSSDGCLATLGAGVWEEGKATITIEQSGAVRVVGKKVLQDNKQRFFNYLLEKDFYVSGGPTNSGGVIFEWYAKQFGDFKRDFDIEDCIDYLVHEASKVPAGAGGLLFLPYLLGERAPIWNADAKGVYFGLNIKHEKQHFIRATIEGILFEIYSIAKTLEEHRTINTLSINGSYACLPFWAQMIADIFNKPVSTKANSDSIGLGTFLLSATEMGVYKNLEEAAQTVTLSKPFKPRQEEHAVYKRHFDIFEKLSTKLFDEFAAISSLQVQE
jgi:gluconokinase